eukprot:4974771-Prymnesium_polylepis.1
MYAQGKSAVPALPLTLRAAPPATAAHLAAAWHRSSRGASSCAATRTYGCAVRWQGRRDRARSRCRRLVRGTTCRRGSWDAPQSEHSIFFSA